MTSGIDLHPGDPRSIAQRLTGDVVDTWPPPDPAEAARLRVAAWAWLRLVLIPMLVVAFAVDFYLGWRSVAWLLIAAGLVPVGVGVYLMRRAGRLTPDPVDGEASR